MSKSNILYLLTDSRTSYSSRGGLLGTSVITGLAPTTNKLTSTSTSTSTSNGNW